MQIPNSRSALRHSFLVAAFFLAAAAAPAAIFTLPSVSLTPPNLAPSEIVNFGEVSLGTPINGLSIKGFSFAENIPNAVVSSGGPSPALNIISPSAQSGGGYSPATYVLTVTMPYPVKSFGFGYAILDFIPTANAVSVTLFDGLTNLGMLTYPGAPDPTFNGGFVGIGSTDLFTSARINFGPTAVQFAIDNFAVPEPGALGLLLLGGALTGLRRQRRR